MKIAKEPAWGRWRSQAPSNWCPLSGSLSVNISQRKGAGSVLVSWRGELLPCWVFFCQHNATGLGLIRRVRPTGATEGPNNGEPDSLAGSRILMNYRPIDYGVVQRAVPLSAEAGHSARDWVVASGKDSSIGLVPVTDRVPGVCPYRTKWVGTPGPGEQR